MYENAIDEGFCSATLQGGMFRAKQMASGARPARSQFEFSQRPVRVRYESPAILSLPSVKAGDRS